MKCPNCGSTLVMSERNGVEIDYCPDCRGVWLDRGELDKIIERSSISTQNEPGYSDRKEKYRDKYDDSSYHKKRKRDSFLGDLFDF